MFHEFTVTMKIRVKEDGQADHPDLVRDFFNDLDVDEDYEMYLQDITVEDTGTTYTDDGELVA